MLKILGGYVKRKSESRFARDAAMLQIAAVVNMVSNFGTSVVVFRTLGAHGYGQYAEAINLFTLMFFLSNVGFSQLTIARVSEAMGASDPARITRWLGFFFKAYGVFSLVMMCGGFLILPALARLYLDDDQVGWWGAALGASGLVSLPFYLVQCALHGTRRMKTLAEMENLKEITRSYFIITFTLGVGDPRGAIGGELAGALFSIPLAWMAYWKGKSDPGIVLPRLKEIVASSKTVSWSEVWELAKKGALLSVNKNFQALMPTVLPRLFLGHFASEVEVGYLNLAQNLMKLPLTGLQGVSRALMPALGQLRGAGEEHRMRSVLVRIMALSGGAVMVATAAFALFLHWMIPTLYGEAARPALDLVWWLFVACTIAGFAVGSESFYIVIDRIDVAVKISVTFVAITAPIGYFMIQSWHATGAAAFIALVHGSAATSVAYVFYYLSKPHGHAPVAPPAPEKLSA